MSVPNRHVFLTGAARGIGAAIAHTLARAGYDLSLLGRDERALQRLMSQLPGNGRKQVNWGGCTPPV